MNGLYGFLVDLAAIFDTQPNIVKISTGAVAVLVYYFLHRMIIKINKRIDKIKQAKVIDIFDFLNDKQYLRNKNFILLGKYKRIYDEYNRMNQIFKIENMKDVENIGLFEKLIFFINNLETVKNPSLTLYTFPDTTIIGGRSFFYETLKFPWRIIEKSLYRMNYKYLSIPQYVINFGFNPNTLFNLNIYGWVKDWYDGTLTLASDDMVGTYCKYKNRQIVPKYIFSGNKYNLLFYLKKNITQLKNLNTSILIFLISMVGTYLLRFMKYSMEKKTFIKEDKLTNDENKACIKCKRNNIRVITSECNHFVLCGKCFIETNKRCPLCNIESNNYILIRDIKNLIS